MSGPDDPNAQSDAPISDAVETPASGSGDVVFVHGPTEHGVQITRLRDERVEMGELRPIKEGQSIVGELVKLSPRPENERLFDVEVLAKGPTFPRASSSNQGAARKGPPRVASDRFRSNWDVVFASRKKGELPS